MKTSKTIAGLAGPYLLATGLTEALNLKAMEQHPASLVLVYLNGSLLFMAGIAVLRVHNRWVRGWPVLATLAGWAGLLSGLARMVAPSQTTSGSNGVYGLLAVMVAAGAVLTVKGCAAGDE